MPAVCGYALSVSRFRARQRRSWQRSCAKCLIFRAAHPLLFGEQQSSRPTCLPWIPGMGISCSGDMAMNVRADQQHIDPEAAENAAALQARFQPECLPIRMTWSPPDHHARQSPAHEICHSQAAVGVGVQQASTNLQINTVRTDQSKTPARCPHTPLRSSGRDLLDSAPDLGTSTNWIFLAAHGSES